MTDHDALLRAICDHPDDDTPRLIFADFLEENGQGERAAFIRTDIEMERRDPFDAERLRWELFEKSSLTGDDSPLVAALPPLPPKCGWTRDPRFRRGLPWTVACEETTSLAPLAEHVFLQLPLTRLFVFRERGQPLAGLLKPAWPVRLTGLAICGGEIARDEVARFVASPLAAGLRELSLQNEPFRADAFQILAASPVFGRLTKLTIKARLRGRAELDAITSYPSPGVLRELHLSITDRPNLGRLLAAPLLGCLEALHLDIASPGAIGAQQLAAAGALKSVRSLTIRTPLGDAGFDALFASPYLAMVQSLSLARTGINAARVEQFAASPTFANMRALDLSSNSLGNAGATAIATSPHLAGLRVLDLSYTQLGDDGFRAILDSPLADGLAYFKATKSPASAEMKQAVREKFGDRVIL